MNHVATILPPTHAPAADVQQGLVYGFERECVECIAPEFMSREEIRSLVLRAANLTGIEVPTLVFRGDLPWPCLADILKWEITINDWGRNPTTVLHEVAHLVTSQEPRGRMEMMRGQAHGPVFLRNAIDLYADFIGVRRSDLERRAQEFGLVIAAPVIANAPKIAGDFYNDDF